MCDRHTFGTGWTGWRPLPAARPDARPAGPWLDLTHPFGPEVPRLPVFPPPRFDTLKALPADPITISSLEFVAHVGTHVDSPRHFFTDGPAFEDIPLDRLSGPGVVWPVAVEAEGLIETRALEAATPRLEPGDILALHTGWSAHTGTPLYDRHPSLSLEAAAWLVAQGIKLLAVDFPTPDLAGHLRPAGFDWPVHKLLLSHGVLICEHLTGHDALVGQRAEFFFGALPVVGGDGAPARVAARPLAG
ncbi:cyclase family protein [Xanthobacter sp. V4C-4]|uniref:cyclase family protein n=1 Tax=Xanthobacter cornucopiae TaxID=3119924 RepID=UPI00372B076D